MFLETFNPTAALDNTQPRIPCIRFPLEECSLPIFLFFSFFFIFGIFKSRRRISDCIAGVNLRFGQIDWIILRISAFFSFSDPTE